MPTPNPIPRKTQRGRDEQRTRTGGLGQRHRTILFLVDGLRTADDVIRLARQAGVSEQHFHDLLRLGYVELNDSGTVLHAPDPVRETAAAAAARVDWEPIVRAPQRPPDVPAPGFRTTGTPPVLDEVAVPRVSGAPLVPVHRPAGAAVAPVIAPRAIEDPALMDEARAHLLEALRLDPPPFVSRLASRVRSARDGAALSDLVLQLERELGRLRRSAVGLHHLEQARELLGLGNTMVAEDSSWHGWPDTL